MLDTCRNLCTCLGVYSCSGSDISLKSAKGKNRILIVLPFHVELNEFSSTANPQSKSDEQAHPDDVAVASCSNSNIKLSRNNNSARLGVLRNLSSPRPELIIQAEHVSRMYSNVYTFSPLLWVSYRGP